MAELDDSDTRENLIATIFNEMASDCDWQSRRLLRIYALARISQTSTGIACRYSTFESEINVLQPFDLQSKEDSLF